MCGVGFGCGNVNGWAGCLLIGLLWWVIDRFVIRGFLGFYMAVEEFFGFFMAV